jgi:hypothetical protein
LLASAVAKVIPLNNNTAKARHLPPKLIAALLSLRLIWERHEKL